MIIGEEIADCIEKNEQKIRTHLRISDGQWINGKDSMIKCIKKINELKDIKENYLTFILACAYAIKGKEDALLGILSEHQLSTETSHIWFQYSPHTCKDPKSGQSGKSHSTLDLAFGCIEKRDNKEREIVYKTTENCEGWICFVEMKILADISGDSTDNPTYNQMVKYIKSAFTFQEYGASREKRYPENIHIVIVTPKRFIDNLHSRLYGYKFEEYLNEDEITKIKTINVNNIKSDIPKQINNEFFSKYICWNEILNNDYRRFKEFVHHYYEIMNIKDENIQKNNDNTSISVSDDNGRLLLNVKKNDNKVKSKKDNKTKKLIAVNENGEENIFYDENFIDLWDRPNIDDRLKKLNLHWIPYEDILDAVPESDLKKYISQIREANPIFDKSPESK